jgi:hypothetical protein
VFGWLLQPPHDMRLQVYPSWHGERVLFVESESAPLPSSRLCDLVEQARAVCGED